MLQLFLTLLFLVVGNLGPANAQEWVEYRPPDAGYRTEFPAAPTVSTTAIDDQPDSAKMTIARYEGRRRFELLSIHDDYPTTAEVDDPEVAFNSARNGALAAVKGKLRQETRFTVDGLPARRIVVDIPEAKLAVVALLVLNGRRVYQLIAVAPLGQEDSANVQRFLNSFAVVPD